MQLWRHAWRLRRATFASAVLVIQDCQDRVLILPCAQSLRLPSIEIRAWNAIATQVEEYLTDLSQTCTASLVAVDGGPSPDGVTFLYGARCEGEAFREGQLWLEPDIAVDRLNAADSRLLRLRIGLQRRVHPT